MPFEKPSWNVCLIEIKKILKVCPTYKKIYVNGTFLRVLMQTDTQRIEFTTRTTKVIGGKCVAVIMSFDPLTSCTNNRNVAIKQLNSLLGANETATVHVESHKTI